VNIAMEPEAKAAPSPTIAENLCRVVSNAPVNSEYRLLVTAAPPLALTIRAGQFFHLACPAIGEDQPFLRRPMSIYQADLARGEISFLYKVQGAGTRGLASLRPGDTLDALGPLGRGFVVPPDSRHMLLLARGVGLATLAPLAGLARDNGVAVTAVLSARSPGLIMSEAYLRSMGATTAIVTDATGDSSVEQIETLLQMIHAERPIDFVATCGSNRLLTLLQRLAAEWSIEGQVALEQHMGCGMGMCFACVRPFRTADGAEDYRRVCWDGPVFDLQEATAWLT
jgi:dihydroorotate dehydrogenase electron transfer subunit